MTTKSRVDWGTEFDWSARMRGRQESQRHLTSEELRREYVGEFRREDMTATATSSVCGWPQEGHHTKDLEPFDTSMYEYDTSEGPRKGEIFPPPGDGWEELDWRRDDHVDVALWRRRRIK